MPPLPHMHPLPCIPPAMHTPLAMHASLSCTPILCTPPVTHAPHATHTPLAMHKPPATHIPPITHDPLPCTCPPPTMHVPPYRQNDWHTLLKILSFPKLRLRAVKFNLDIQPPIHFPTELLSIKRLNNVSTFFRENRHARFGYERRCGHRVGVPRAARPPRA